MGVIIIREMVGTSPRSWSDAARQAVATAARTVRNIRSVEVVKSTAVVEDGEISEYRGELKLYFEYGGWARRSRRGIPAREAPHDRSATGCGRRAAKPQLSAPRQTAAV